MRRRRNQNPRAKRAIKATAATPIPIPALAPVERLLLFEADVEASEVCVAEAVLLDVLVDLLVVEGRLTDEKPGWLMAFCWLNEKLCLF